MNFFKWTPFTSNSKLCGISWRESFGKELNKSLAKVCAWEVIGDNFSEQELLSLSNRLPNGHRALHFLGLNIAGIDPLSDAYIDKMKRLSAVFKPRIVSDHLSWCQNKGSYLFDLLPFKKNRSQLERIAKRIHYVQNRLGRQLTLENISEYSFFDRSAHEVEFLKELCSMTGCGVLFDVNNFLVNHRNRFLELQLPSDYEQILHDHLHSMWPLVRELPITQIHVAGNRAEQSHWIDDHGSAPQKICWELANDLSFFYPKAPVILEWDNNIPSFEKIIRQISHSKRKKSDFRYSEINSHSDIIPIAEHDDSKFQDDFVAFIKSKEYFVQELLSIEVSSASHIYRTNSVFTALQSLKNIDPERYSKIGEKNFRFYVREWIYSTERQNTLEIQSIDKSFQDYLNQGPLI